MYLTKEDIEGLDKVKRLNIINSVSGIKPANLIGSISNNGVSNLAIISSVVHLGSNPAFLGFISRPGGEVPRHTYENIEENSLFTINHIRASFIEKAHYTSGKFERGISEFDACGLTEEYISDFKAPFVKESVIKIGLKHVESIPIKSSGTVMVVGEVHHLTVPEEAMNDEGYLNLEKANGIGISGLNSYYELKKISDFPYVRIAKVPKF